MARPAGPEAAASGQPSFTGQIVRAPKTAELIAGQLRRQIVRGELQAGDTLPPEPQLMSQFGVSRPTLREAFRILETENLISVRRGSRGGARVTRPDLSVAARYVGLLLQVQGTTIIDVYDALMALEPACAKLLARRRTKQDLADLGTCVEELRSVAGTSQDEVPEPGRWSGLTYRFHQLIMQRCGNKTLAVQGGVLQEIVETHLALTVPRAFGEQQEAREQFRRTIRSYQKLLALLGARDADGAERHWRSHMEAIAKRLFREDLKNQSVVDLFS